MRWRVIMRVAGAACAASAVVVALLQVHVGGAGAAGRSCGTALDVIVDRAGWETWYAQDSVDPPSPPASPLLRTLQCPGAVNARTVVAGILLGIGLVAGVATLDRRRRERDAPAMVDLARLGRIVTVAGGVLAIGGLTALGVLLADRDAPMFTYVGRPSVLAIGLVALAPVLALVAGGRALVLLARRIVPEERGHAPA